MRYLRTKRRRILLFFAVMGPGIITASVDQDAGGIATYSLAGAHYGYSLLWSLFFIMIALAVVQEMGTRMGVVTGKGLADLVRERFGVRMTLGIMTILVLANLANTASEFAGVAAALEIFGISRYLSIPLTVVLVSWLVVKGTYRIVERIFLGASLFYAVYIVSAFLARPSWPEIARQIVQPAIRLEQGYLLMLITLVGTTIAPWMQFYLQSSIVDKGVRIKQYRYARLDAIFGSLVATTVAFFIIVSCGATLYAHGIQMETAGQAAMAIRSFAGRYASLLFGLGLLNASIFSATIVPLSTAYAVSESLGLETGVDRSLKEAPSFFAIYLGMVAIGAALILWPKAPLIKIMLLSQTLNGILLPLILFLMLKLINDRDVMGPYVNSRWTNVLAWGTALLLILLTLLLLVVSLMP